MARKTERWAEQKDAIRATQLAFDLSVSVQKHIKKMAIDEQLTPSDMIRTILGLDVRTKKTRQRLTVSLNENDFRLLAKKYELESGDHVEIKKMVAKELADNILRK